MTIDFATAFASREKAWWPEHQTGERIVFWQRQSYGKNRQAIEKRVAAIFTPTEIADCWTKLRSNEGEGNTTPSALLYEPPQRFQIDPRQFIARARLSKPADLEPTASGFAQWVYSLYSSVHGDVSDLERGIETERGVGSGLDEFLEADADDRIEKIEQRGAYRRKKLCDLGDELVGPRLADWELVHSGLHLQGEVTPWFNVADLCVGNEPLRTSPDLLFKNSLSGEVIVVEIKRSVMEIPSNLWPNIWAQLWCCAQIPLVREASRVTVVGEVWGEKWIRESRRDPPAFPHLFMRASVRRDPRAPKYDIFFRKLFTIYAGGDPVQR
ncbi:hypothetical protein AWB80_06251 [Caballeronia pedi]|uniref:Uncharacterized protein n=1 Tax=Caballeronia pedi TaxID=1777141 RepID=A0A158D3Y0_9BURK|nr:hypothetical protein [Caballeronia pedi]SAK89193.1 hypothetical protein AWB80_06251 [Caballeronia pedi]